MRIRGLILFLPLVFASMAHAQATYPAASCSESNVQSAYTTEQASKVDGDVITIPTGSACTWTSEWTISPTNSLTFQGNTVVTFPSGMSASNPATATDNTEIISDTPGVMWNINVASSKELRLTGLTIATTSSGTQAQGVITFNGTCSSLVRIDHNHFNDLTASDHTIQQGGVCGVADHNFFDSTNQADVFFFQFTNPGTGTYGDEFWNSANNFGSSSVFFVESNFFQNGTFVYDCFIGGSYVVRFNIVGYNTRLQSHGLTPDIHRGCKEQEDYENNYTFSSDPASSSFAFLMDQEGATGFWWGDTITGFLTFQREYVVRTGSSPYTPVAVPNSWGACSSSPVAGVAGPSNWDQNVSGQGGWRCLDGVGNGPGDLLSGDFPTKCDATLSSSTPGACGSGTYTGVWSSEISEPMYVWDSTLNSSSYGAPTFWGNLDTVSVENRDYYLQLPNNNESGSFTGAAGIGQGPRSSRPSTCTPYVGWWATDQGSWNTSSGNNLAGYSGQGVLDVCTATNTWTNAYYTPYTFPNPLTSGTSQASPPSCTPTSGAVPQTVTCTNPNSGTTIMCYAASPTTPATNGSGTGCTTGSQYTGSLSISSPETLEVIAGVASETDSSVVSYSYTAGISPSSIPAIFAHKRQNPWLETLR